MPCKGFPLSELPDGLLQIKSRRSGPNGGNSLMMVALPGGGVGVYSTLVPEDEAWVLVFSNEAAKELVAEIEAGRFDHLDLEFNLENPIGGEILVRSLTEGDFSEGVAMAMASNSTKEVWFNAEEMNDFLDAVANNEFAEILDAVATESLAVA